MYNYGNGIKEVRNVCMRTTYKPREHTKVVNKKMYVDTDTGEVKERKQPNSKADVKNISRSMLHEYRLLLYNINKAVPDGKVYFITMTNERMIPYEEFNTNLDKFIKKLKYANAQISDEDFKYAFFKEANEDGRYHIHGFIWYQSNETLHLSEDIINAKWCFGTGQIKQIPTSEDLMETLMYVCNYSDRDKSNEKVMRKRNGLAFFPPNTHLVSRVKGLEDVPCTEADEAFMPDMDQVICQSTRDQENIYYQSTFYKDN